MWMPRVALACRVEIAIFLLSGCHQHKYAVYVCFKLFVRICLKDIACSLDCLIYISVIEREAAYDAGGIRVYSLYEIAVAAILFTFAERKRDCHLAAGLESGAPERIVDLDVCKCYLSIRVAIGNLAGTVLYRQREDGEKEDNYLAHRRL